MQGAHCAIYWGGTSSCLHMGFVFPLLFCQHWMCRSSLNQFVSFMYSTITSASASSLLSPLLSYSLPLRRPETGVWAWSRTCILITLTLDTWWERAVKLSKHISVCGAAARTGPLRNTCVDLKTLAPLKDFLFEQFIIKCHRSVNVAYDPPEFLLHSALQLQLDGFVCFKKPVQQRRVVLFAHG